MHYLQVILYNYEAFFIQSSFVLLVARANQSYIPYKIIQFLQMHHYPSLFYLSKNNKALLIRVCCFGFIVLIIKSYALEVILSNTRVWFYCSGGDRDK